MGVACVVSAAAAAALLQLIARLGRWLRTALNTSYLRFFKPKGLLAAAGWDKDRPDAFFDERFCLDVEDDLVLLSGHRQPGLVTGGSMEGPGGLRVAAVRTLKVGVWDVWACQQQQMLCCSAHSIQSVAC